jgi:hypothetical protein
MHSQKKQPLATTGQSILEWIQFLHKGRRVIYFEAKKGPVYFFSLTALASPHRLAPLPTTTPESAGLCALGGVGSLGSVTAYQ